MPAETTRLMPLSPHPAAPARAVEGVSAGCRLAGDGRLHFAWRISAAPQRLVWDQAGAPGRRDELWRHTCFEAFLATGPESYLEFNFSPDGSWAAYAFSSYRRRSEPDPPLSRPDLRLHIAEEALGLDADIHLGPAFDVAGAGALRASLAAVVEEAGGYTSYWALRHPLPKPDFHDAGGFVFTLSPAKPSTDLEDLSA